MVAVRQSNLNQPTRLAVKQALAELDGRQIDHAVLLAASRASNDGLAGVPVAYLEEAAASVLRSHMEEKAPSGFRR